jgi:hypothetical protein
MSSTNMLFLFHEHIVVVFVQAVRANTMGKCGYASIHDILLHYLPPVFLISDFLAV